MTTQTAHSLDVGPQALVLVDLQCALLEGEEAVPDARSLRKAVETQLEKARTAGCLVIHLQNDGAVGAPDEAGTVGWQLALPVEPNEPVLRKEEDDGFDGTALEQLLLDAGAEHVSVGGVNSEMRVAASARGALAPELLPPLLDHRDPLARGRSPWLRPSAA